MAHHFAKVLEEIEEAFFYPPDLVDTKTTIPLRVGEEQWIYTSTHQVSVYIHHYSPPLRGIVVYYQPHRNPFNHFCQWKKYHNNNYCQSLGYLQSMTNYGKKFQYDCIFSNHHDSKDGFD